MRRSSNVQRRCSIVGWGVLLAVATFLPPIACAYVLARWAGPGAGDRLLEWVAAPPRQTVGSDEVPPFSLVDQQGRTVTREDLKGHPWVASFMLTRCAGTCPMTTAKVAALRARLPRDDRIKLVSFTVDPDHDTPEVLNAYATKFDAAPDQWRFLTGNRSTIVRLAVDTGVADSTEGLVHSEQILLVDTTGKIVGRYATSDDVQMERLATAAIALAQSRAF